MKLGAASVAGCALYALLFLAYNPFPLFGWIATFVGALVMCKCVLGPALAIWEHFFMKRLDIVERYGKGSWAVITGGSDGIGLAVATKLAEAGINVMLVARNEKKLKDKVRELNKSLPKKTSVKVDYRVADFSKGTSPEFYTALYDTMKDLDVSILVNNVGMGAMPFNEATVQQAWDQGVVNMIPQFMMTKVFLEHFQNRSTKCAVVDISSMASLAEYTDSGLYGGTKAFNRAFTMCMEEKYGKDFGIDFLSIKPGFVLTNIGDGSGKTITDLFKDGADGKMVFTAEQAATGVLKAMGNVIESYGVHGLVGFVIDAIIWMTPALQIRQVLRILRNK